MGWFGPSKDEVWRQLSQGIRADFVDGGFWKGNKVQLHVKPWTITLDTHAESAGESSVTYTGMRAPFINPEGFRFTVYRKGIFSDLGKLLGMQDIFDLFATVLDQLCRIGSVYKQEPGVTL